MKELVVISGKGGTGKTSVVASFAALARNPVIVDCDVDAPDLHLVLSPTIERRQPFMGGKLARINPEQCTACGKCELLCRFGAVHHQELDDVGHGTFQIDPVACEGCGVCAWFCRKKAIAFEPALRGEWYHSSTRFGPMLHARLNAAAANSGKLVTTLREEARRVAAATGSELILVDGSPGIGCPVIASITGAALVLIVTEPTLTGEHDMARVLILTRSLGVPAAVCVNRADIDLEMASQVEARGASAGAVILPRIGFDPLVSHAQEQGRTVVELPQSQAAQDIKAGWNQLCQTIQ